MVSLSKYKYAKSYATWTGPFSYKTLLPLECIKTCIVSVDDKGIYPSLLLCLRVKWTALNDELC